MNMKDGEENTEVVTNSIITAEKKINPKQEDNEIEIVPNAAEAGSEFSWGFLFWSFMNFGAENAISGHSGYWLSKRDVEHDFWQAAFNNPQMIDTIQIAWRLPPKRIKIFYKLDENNDWIGATEVFIKEDVKDKNGNIIPGDASNMYNTVYFKKPLICTRIKIMMNQPLKKKSFSITTVNFYNKIGRGIIKAPLLDQSNMYCWFINTSIIRKNVPLYVYPCVESIQTRIGTELFQINTNKQIKPYANEFCIGYLSDTKEVVLSECQDEGSAFLINYNADSSMYFVGMHETAISIDVLPRFKNFISENSEIIASSEADKSEFRKENALIETGSYWASEPGVNDVTMQILFGKISCKECKEDGTYESKKIDMININWKREPKKFSVFIWNPGYSWKNIANFANNTDKLTNISLVGETAAGIMIRMTEGNQYENLGNMVSYAIASVYASFRGHALKITKQSKKPLAYKFFDFESQNYLVTKSASELDNEQKNLGTAYERAINAYKNIKNSASDLKQSKKEALDICKKINSFYDICGHKAFEKLKKFQSEDLQKISNLKFLTNLKNNGNENVINYLTGKINNTSNDEGKANTGGNSENANKNFFINPLANIDEKNNYLKDVSGIITKNKINNSNSNGENSGNIGELQVNKILSQGTSSKKNSENTEGNDSKDIGSKEFPAADCLEIKKLNQFALSGFYYIYPECSPNPLRVFCDFALFADAVDIYIFKDDSKLQTPNLSYLNVRTQEDVLYNCSKVGLQPIDLKNKDMVSRIHQILVASGMKLIYPNFVPLGYDYTCKFDKCSKIFNSLSTKKSVPIINFFDENFLTQNHNSKGVAFAGLGTVDSPHMVLYDPNHMTITSLICSTNNYEISKSRNSVKSIDCDFNVSNNLDIFSGNNEKTLLCPRNCQNSPKEVLGSGIYHINSSICKAALHAGVLSGNGGKISVFLQKAEKTYNGSSQNGINSINYIGDGNSAFIVYKYKPNCPKIVNNNKQKDNLSFIEKEEKIEFKDKEVLENKINNQEKPHEKENNLNDLNVKILLESILNGINNEKNTELSKKLMLLKQLIPSSYIKSKENSMNVENNEDHSNKKSELEKIITSNLNSNSEIYKNARFFEKSQEKNALNSKLNFSTESKNKSKSLGKQLPALGAMASLAASTANNLLNNSEAQNAAALANNNMNMLKNLIPGIGAPNNGYNNNNNNNNSPNNNPQLDALAAQNQAVANQNQGDGGDMNNNSLGNGTPPGDPTNVQGNSISNPINNPLTSGQNALNNQLANISKAAASPQRYEDPNLANNASNSNDMESNNRPSQIPGKFPQKNVIAEPELPGQKQGSSNSNPFDLSKPSEPNGNLVDPNEMSQDNGGDSNGNSDNGSKDTSYQSGDVPGNHGLSNPGVDTEKAKSKLKKLYNSSLEKDMNKMKEKAKKIGQAVSQFLTNINQALNGSANNDLINKESGNNSSLDISNNSANDTGKSNNHSAQTGDSASKVNIKDCNIANSSTLYSQLIEEEQKLSDFMSSLNQDSQSRIYKTNQIKENWSEKLNVLSSQDPITIDYSIYPDQKKASSDIFGRIFDVINLGNDEIYNSKWGIFTKNIKSRQRVMGIELNPNNTNGLVSSMLMLKSKNYYDVKIKLDILIANNGTAGIIFRAKDRYNFYCFLIDKKSGSKAITKVVNGNMEILKKINDGGILINEWHSILIEVKASKIYVYMYDAETSNKAITEKTIVVEDDTFIKGSVGILANGIKGLYFDKFSASPLTCWSPWIPKENLTIRNPNANIYREDFRENLLENYEIHNVDESTVKDGPAIWELVNSIELGEYIIQSNLVYDSSEKRMPNLITLKNINFQNGIYEVQIIPLTRKGIISVIFKYNVMADPKKPYDKVVQFYIFEMDNESIEPQFSLRMYINGDFKLLQSINTTQISPHLKSAFLYPKVNTVRIEAINENITIKVSQDNSDFYNIFNLENTSIAFGTIGFGTFRSPAKFISLNLNPPKLDLKKDDIAYILNKNYPLIPMPSPSRIKDAASKSSYVQGKVSKNNTATGILYHQSALLASSLGYDFGKPEEDKINNISQNVNNNLESISNKKQDDSPKPVGGWKQCLYIKTDKSRKSYCQNEFGNNTMKDRCQHDFCNTCCLKNASQQGENILHMCKKACYKSSIAVDNSNEYKNICINSNDPKINVFDYCQTKMSNYDQKLLAYCKMDMCNLCCVNMDTIKKKNFSFSNVKRCFNECSSEFNVGNLNMMNILNDSQSHSNFDYLDIFKSENYSEIEILSEISAFNSKKNFDAKEEINSLIKQYTEEKEETSNSDNSSNQNNDEKKSNNNDSSKQNSDGNEIYSEETLIVNKTQSNSNNNDTSKQSSSNAAPNAQPKFIKNNENEKSATE